MADLLSFLKTILDAWLNIKSALEKADHNAEECRTIGRTIGQTLSAIADAKYLEDNTTKGLEVALQRASEIVKKCEHKTLACRAFKANHIANELQGVCNDILLNLQTVVLTIVADNNKTVNHISSMLAKFVDIFACPDVHLRRQEMVQTDCNSIDDASYQNKNERETKKTDLARSQFETENDTALVDSKAPRPSLSDGSAKSIQVESVIGQGVPSILDKAHSGIPADGNGSSRKNENETEKTDGPNTVRLQVKIETNNEPTDSKGPHASLSVCPAKSTSLKSVIGQGGPSIVNKIISIPSERVTSLDMHPTKAWIVMSEEGKVSIWDYQEKKTVMELQVNEVPGKAARLMHETSQYFKESSVPHLIYSAKFIVQEKWLVVGDGYGYIYVYAYTDKLDEIKKFGAHRHSVDSLAVHPTKPYLLSSSADGRTIKLWDWSKDWVQIKKFEVKATYPDGVRSLKFNPRDTNTFACVTYDDRVKVGNTEKSSHLTTTLEGPFKADYCFSRSHRHLMVTLSSPNAQIWDLDTEKVVHTLEVSGSESKTTCVACHPTLPILVTTLDDGTVCFWDAITYRLEERIHIIDMDRRVLDLVFVAGVDDKARLVVTFESVMVIMEINLPM